MIDQKPAQEPPFSAYCRDMAANRGAIDHVLPVIGQAQINQRLQQRIPNALLGPASEPHIDGVPLAVALVHVAPGAADPQHMKHAVEKTPIIARWSSPAPPLGWQQGANQFPLSIRQVPTVHDCSLKSSLDDVDAPALTGAMLSVGHPKQEQERLR
ncbi:hypothetical protein BF95_01085 [Sphingobium sp. Ant17]|nr:hypothetical protein BF95_01085 [Sphingobium sp. Ant17]